MDETKPFKKPFPVAGILFLIYGLLKLVIVIISLAYGGKNIFWGAQSAYTIINLLIPIALGVTLLKIKNIHTVYPILFGILTLSFSCEFFIKLRNLTIKGQMHLLFFHLLRIAAIIVMLIICIAVLKANKSKLKAFVLIKLPIYLYIASFVIGEIEEIKKLTSNAFYMELLTFQNPTYFINVFAEIFFAATLLVMCIWLKKIFEYNMQNNNI